MKYMEVGADYHDLAEFYWETGEKEKSIQIARKGLKKATGRMDELRAFVAERAKESGDRTTWKDAPKGKIQKFDVSVAKNYLTENEMVQLQRLVSAYLDVAEDMALRQIPMTMQDWEKRLNRFIEATDREILNELLEKAIDLGADRIEIEYKDGSEFVTALRGPVGIGIGVRNCAKTINRVWVWKSMGKELDGGENNDD